MKIISGLFAIVSLSLAADSIDVIRVGTGIRLETQFSPGITLVQPLGVRPPLGVMNFAQPFLRSAGKKDIPLANNHDDACPWNFNHTYIGGNHGDSAGNELVFRQPHSLTEKDCGSAWFDEQKRKFYIVKIKDPQIIWTLSDDLNPDKDIWYFGRVKGKTLTNVETGKVLTDFKTRVALLNSPVRLKPHRFLADGKPLTEKERNSCREFAVEEEYDIIATDAILAHVKKNPGRQVEFNAPGLDKVLTQKIVYTFYPDGSCIVTHRVKFFRKVRTGYMGFLQFGQMDKGKYTSHLYYVPKVLPFESGNVKWNFAGREDFTRPIAGSIYLKSETYENPASPPERFIQYLSGGDGPEVAFAAGYSLIEGCSVPTERSRNSSTALFLYRSHKSYPYALDRTGMPEIKAGTEFYCMIYRQYFNPAHGFYMNRQGNSMIMYVDFHKPEKAKKIALPKTLWGKSMVIVEKHPGVSVQKLNNVILFNSSGKYGYAVLRFME